MKKIMCKVMGVLKAVIDPAFPDFPSKILKENLEKMNFHVVTKKWT
jgi:hypothetical protein